MKTGYLSLIAFSFLCLCGGVVTLQGYYPQSTDETLQRIAFGSCNRQNKPQPHWEAIAEAKPDLWIWLGDCIYGDTRKLPILEKKYNELFYNTEYAKFRRQIPIIGTWDDHDYGENNAGSWYPLRRESQSTYFDFLEVPESSPLRNQEGVYSARVFGRGERAVKIILLDGRYHAEKPGKDADLLGETQWAWLENELKTTQAPVNIIGSGIQVLAEDHKYEKWSDFPKSREHLFALIKKHQVPGVIFISGDRHLHEMMVKSDLETEYPLFEVTSSGLTHSWEGRRKEFNRYRYGGLHRGKGFGMIEFDWDAQSPHVALKIIDLEGVTVNEIRLQLNGLKSDSMQRAD